MGCFLFFFFRFWRVVTLPAKRSWSYDAFFFLWEGEGRREWVCRFGLFYFLFQRCARISVENRMSIAFCSVLVVKEYSKKGPDFPTSVSLWSVCSQYGAMLCRLTRYYSAVAAVGKTARQGRAEQQGYLAWLLRMLLQG